MASVLSDIVGFSQPQRVPAEPNTAPARPTSPMLQDPPVTNDNGPSSDSEDGDDNNQGVRTLLYSIRLPPQMLLLHLPSTLLTTFGSPLLVKNQFSSLVRFFFLFTPHSRSLHLELGMRPAPIYQQVTIIKLNEIHSRCGSTTAAQKSEVSNQLVLTR